MNSVWIAGEINRPDEKKACFLPAKVIGHSFEPANRVKIESENDYAIDKRLAQRKPKKSFVLRGKTFCVFNR